MQILGIHLDRPFLYLAVLETGRRRTEILLLKTLAASEPELVKPLYMNISPRRIVSGLSCKHLLIRSVHLEIASQRNLAEALVFQAEATTHLDPAEMLAVPLLQKKSDKTTEATFFLASRESLRLHLEEWNTFHLDPDVISATPLALVQYIQWKHPALQNAFLVDLGSAEWSCVWMEEGRIQKAYSLAEGTEVLLESFWEDRKKVLPRKDVENAAKQIDLLQLRANLNPHFHAKLQEMRQALARRIFSFRRGAEKRAVFFTGRLDAFGHLREYLLQEMGDAVEEDRTAGTPEELKFAIPLGLALEGSLQFRKEEFFPARYWRKMGKYVLGLFASVLLCSFLLLFFAQKRIHARQNQMLLSLEQFLDRSDLEIKQQIFSDAASPTEKIRRWKNLVRHIGQEFPYPLTVPKASDVLAWFSSHPLIQGEDPLALKELSYQLVRYPKIGSLEEPYQAKVEILFDTRDALNARKFHEALLKGDAVVDEQQPIGWDVLPDGYKTSFFLKTRNFYVF